MWIIKFLKTIYNLLVHDHVTFPIRMAIVFMVVRSFYIDDYSFTSELKTAGLYLICFFLLYVLTSVLNIKRADSSPFYLSEFLEKKVNEDYLMRDVLTLPDKRGVYVRNMHVEGVTVISTFNLHNNPEFIKGRASAFSLILSSMNLPSQDKTIDRLNKIVEEANFMIYEK